MDATPCQYDGDYTRKVQHYSAGMCPEISAALYRTGTIQGIENDVEIHRVPAGKHSTISGTATRQGLYRITHDLCIAFDHHKIKMPPVRTPASCALTSNSTLANTGFSPILRGRRTSTRTNSEYSMSLKTTAWSINAHTRR